MSSLYPNGLSYTDLSTYARDHGFRVDEFVRLLYALDAVYLAHARSPH